MRQISLAICGVCTSPLFVNTSVFMILPLLPLYSLESLSASYLEIALTISAASISMLLLRLPVGLLIGGNNSVRVMILGDLSVLLASLAYLVVEQPLHMIVARAIFGAVFSGFFPVSLSLTMTSATTPEERDRGIRWFTAAAMFGVTLGASLAEMFGGAII